jgi:hypothetical protein
MTRTKLQLEPLVSNSAGLAAIPGVNEDNLERDGGFQIRYDSVATEAGTYQINAYGNLFQPPRTWGTQIPLSHNDLFAHVEDCRNVWQQVVIQYSQKKRGWVNDTERFPFQEQWDFSKQGAVVEILGRRLALAGEKLFYLIFENNQDPILRAIAQIMRQVTIQREGVFTITSNSFFVPWGMIYTHPQADTPLSSDGMNFRWEGFWGYRHIIEHNTEFIELETGITAESQLIPASLNIDERIDVNLQVKCIAEQRAFFQELEQQKIVVRKERRERAELQQALEADDFADRILYFYCHGSGAYNANGPNLQPANITLTDGEPITGPDITFWLRKNQDFKLHPLVFINACQGGHMTTLFYQTLAAEFLKRKAVGLIGCQVDIPAQFATEYAKRLLSEFLNSSQSPNKKVRLGPLMRDLTRTFIDQYHNPLGLVYSIYRGADCYIDRSHIEKATK